MKLCFHQQNQTHLANSDENIVKPFSSSGSSYSAGDFVWELLPISQFRLFIFDGH